MLVSPPRGRTAGPNVLVIVLDDLGFAQLGCFGSDIATPNIDALAAGGLRYNRFHVTALCSPTRAAVLTGRNHHAVGMGMLPELAIRYEGYNARIPQSAATLARLSVWYDALRTEPARDVAAWRSQAVPWWGALVEVRTAAGERRGRLTAIDEEGALWLETPAGERIRLVSGEVSRVRAIEP